jgi:hypothetical protein
VLEPDLYKLILSLFSEGKNVTSALKSSGIPIDFDVIELLYDLQAGSYTQNAVDNPEALKSFVDEICELSDSILSQSGSILDCGTGEGNTLVPILRNYAHLNTICAIDSSWSRLSWAKSNLFESSVNNFSLAVADIKKIPLLDNSVDLIISIHAIEPNGGGEQFILSEMARVTKKYLILVEPDYLHGSTEQKERMRSLNYIGDLREFFYKAGLNLLSSTQLRNNPNPLNQASIFLLEKFETPKWQPMGGRLSWVDPIFKTQGKIMGNGIRFNSGLWHPILDDIPFLRVSDGKLTHNPATKSL